MQISYKYIIFDTFKKCVFVIFELFARSTDYRHIAFGGGGSIGAAKILLIFTYKTK